MVNSMVAHGLWRSVPDDQRFFTVDEGRAAAFKLAQKSFEEEVNLQKCTVVDEGEQLYLRGASGASAMLNSWSFGQIAPKIFDGAPTQMLRQLPARLAAEVLTHGLQQYQNDGKLHKGLFAERGAGEAPGLRALTGPDYARKWNFEVFDSLKVLTEIGWKVPPARPYRHGQARTRKATAEDVLHNARVGLSVSVGDDIAPAGVYVRPSEFFVFLVDDSNPIEIPGDAAPFFRFLLRFGSETGKVSNGGILGLFRGPCGNHIMWGVKESYEFRYRHMGAGNEQAELELFSRVAEFGRKDAKLFGDGAKAARATVLGSDRESVVDAAYGKRLPELTKKVLSAAYDTALLSGDYGDPNTLWAIVNGLSEVSQKYNSDERAGIDRAAGKLLAMA